MFVYFVLVLCVIKNSENNLFIFLEKYIELRFVCVFIFCDIFDWVIGLMVFFVVVDSLWFLRVKCCGVKFMLIGREDFIMV